MHFDAFRRNKVAYLTAMTWRMLGKRLRARGQLATLLSQSRYAYRLWIMRNRRLGSARAVGNQLPPIVGLVIAGTDNRALDETLENLKSEGVQAFVIGEDTATDIMAAVNSICWDQGPRLLPIQSGDRLAEGAAAIYRKAMRETDSRVLYADDDVLDRRQVHGAPHFKPDWNSELFRHFDYLSGACILKVEAGALQAVAGHADWVSRLLSRAATERTPVHIRHMLHHRASRPMLPVSLATPSIPVDLPKVSVVVPTRNRLDLLRTCMNGLALTDYPDIEVLVVDNDSNDPETLEYLASLESPRRRVLRHAGPFNYSAINNRAVAEAKGTLICLLNNDIEVLKADWLAIMAVQAMRSDVGAVGAQLLYPDGRIQHAGVVIGVGDAAGHAHRFVLPQAEGYFQRHALPQFVSAVTAACLVVDRSKFLAVGGLDEINFAVAFNDVDLCMRLNQRGWQSLYEPRAVLVHHESVSRGDDRDPVGAARFAGELAALKRIWSTDTVVDPFHHPNLSRAAEQFSVAV